MKVFILNFLFFAAVLPAHADVHGLFVGISDYESDEDLPYCADDARRLAAFFQETTGSMRISPQKMRVLTDSAATRARVLGEFRRIKAELREGDLFVLYFSGHGGGENEEERTLVFWDSGELTGPELPLPVSRSVVILDACYSGGIAERVGGEKIFVLASAQKSEPSSVAYAYRSSGGMTHSLLRALGGDADLDSDRAVTWPEIVRYVKSAVPRYCSDCGRLNAASRSRCFFDDTLLSREATHPITRGVLPRDAFSVTRPPAAPCHCGPNPKSCSCGVKGECGEAPCITLGRKGPNGCANPEERAVCSTNAALCPCPEFGGCGMESCESQSALCSTSEDRAECEKDPELCPCGYYGDCDMESCHGAK